MKTITPDIAVESKARLEDPATEFIPILRSGAWADIGFRASMEDVYVCADNLVHEYGVKNFEEGPSAFYGVFPSPLLNLSIIILN